MKEMIEKLETARKIMKDRRHDVAGLGAPIMIITDVINELQVIKEDSFNTKFEKFLGELDKHNKVINEDVKRRAAKSLQELLSDKTVFSSEEKSECAICNYDLMGKCFICGKSISIE